MTGRLLEVLDRSGMDAVLVDRRFSRSVDDVGRASAGKLLAVPHLVVRLVATLLRRRPAAVVLFLTNRPGSFLVDSVLLAVLRFTGVRIVLYVHTVGFAALAARGPVWRRLVVTALRSGGIVTLGPSLLSDIAEFTATAPTVVPNPTDSAPETDRDPSPTELHAVFLSNLLPEKGADAFVRMASALADGSGRWRFTVAGAGSTDRLAALRQAAAHVGAQVDVVGPVDETAKWALLSTADVLVFPSVYPFEAQPLTIVEAMAAGVPVVAYDVGGVRDLITDGENGRLVPRGDELALATAVQDLALDPDARRVMRRAARARHTAAHSMRAYGAAWRTLLDMDDSTGVDGFASSCASFRRLVRADWRANPRDVKSRAVLLGFRLAQLAMRDPERPRPAGMLVVALYRAWTEFGIGLELRPKTRVGGGLTMYHGYSLVVNDHTIIGQRVVLRNGITIGQRTAGGSTPVIGDDVDIGAGAIVLGGIRIGDGARIGAGAVVLADVPDGAAAVGNPARVLPAST